MQHAQAITQAPKQIAAPVKVQPIHFRDHRKLDLAGLLKIIPHVNDLFALPGIQGVDKYILPVSGGGDSSALAIVLHILFPNTPFEMMMTDTKAEDPEIYVSLDALERYLGKRITRLVPEKGLFDLVDLFNGYLPSAQARWCTRILKLENFKPWLAQFDGIQKHMFVGVRSDESTRLAFSIDEVETSMPFIDMGVTRAQVYQILDRTIGIPRYYERRTRSGCTTCFFQRRSELVGLSQSEPKEFARGASFEKLDPINDGRYIGAVPLWQDSGIALNWQILPLPTSETAIKGRKPKLQSMSLFGDRGIFVAAEFFYDGMYANDEFIWHQRVVSYSPTRAGLAGQIDDRYQHLLSTGEVYQMTADDVRAKVKFAIYYVELPETVFDPDPPKGKGYTWQQDSSYNQLKHIVEWTTRALHCEGMRQQSRASAAPLTVQEEWVEASIAGLAAIKHEVGQVVVSEWYTPKEAQRELTVEEEALAMPCPACSI